MVLREGAGERVQYHVIDGWQHLETFDGDDAATCAGGVRPQPATPASPGVSTSTDTASSPGTRHGAPRAIAPAVAKIRGRERHRPALRGVEPARLRRPAGRGAARLWRRRGARTRPGRGILRVARGGVSRLPGIARGQPRVPGGGANWTRPTRRSFYEAARAIDWRAHIDPARTLACDFTGKHPNITHTRFGALRLKDAHLRSVARRHRPPSRHLARAPRGARARACQRSEGDGLHRPFGRRTASARLSHPGR